MLGNKFYVDKNLVLNVCEPCDSCNSLETIIVPGKNSSFKMFRFGQFDDGEDEYIFGCQRKQYNSCFKNKKCTKIPITIAKVRSSKKGESSYELSKFSDFSECESDLIKDVLIYYLRSIDVMSKYALCRC